jgi:uncharacterized protein (DUF58 family)
MSFLLLLFLLLLWFLFWDVRYDAGLLVAVTVSEEAGRGWDVLGTHVHVSIRFIRNRSKVEVVRVLKHPSMFHEDVESTGDRFALSLCVHQRPQREHATRLEPFVDFFRVHF